MRFFIPPSCTKSEHVIQSMRCFGTTYMPPRDNRPVSFFLQYAMVLTDHRRRSQPPGKPAAVIISSRENT
jgi:hypothetical protein